MSASEEVAQICRRKIESLETWFRRLIQDILSNHHGSDYLNATDENGNYLVKKSIRENIEATYNRNQEKYGRMIDATLLDDSIKIVSNPVLYELYFKDALKSAFDDAGNLHSPLLLKNFCERLIGPRNNLSHANPISIRQSEQVICITGDLISSIKKYYRDNGMEQDYNIPLILSCNDHLGIKKYRNEFSSYTNGGKFINYGNQLEYTLYPGDSVSIAVDVDSAFEGEYKTMFGVGGVAPNDFENHFIVDINESDIGQNYLIRVSVVNINPNKKWARMYASIEDILELKYRVLPLR